VKRAHAALSVLVSAGLGAAQPASAQAFLPRPGEASLSVAYTRFEGGDHLYDGDVSYSTRGYVCEGRSCFLGTEQSDTFTGELDLGLHDRVALSGRVNDVRSRYDGNAPANVEIDDGQWRSGFQDAYVQLRFQALRSRALFLTPFVGYQFPLADYPTRGHAARGRGVDAWTVGVSMAKVLRRLPGAYVQFAYSLGSDNLPIDLFRNHFDLDVGYLVSPNLSVGVSTAFRFSSGGLSWTGGADCGHACPPDVDNALSQEAGLGVAASNSQAIQLGAGASYRMFDTSLFVSAVTTLTGENTIDADFFSVGLSRSFRTPWSR